MLNCVHDGASKTQPAPVPASKHSSLETTEVVSSTGAPEAWTTTTEATTVGQGPEEATGSAEGLGGGDIVGIFFAVYLFLAVVG